MAKKRSRSRAMSLLKKSGYPIVTMRPGEEYDLILFKEKKRGRRLAWYWHDGVFWSIFRFIESSPKNKPVDIKGVGSYSFPIFTVKVAKRLAKHMASRGYRVLMY